MERVLLLNATYEPLALVSGRRPVVLMLAGRGEAVAIRAERCVYCPQPADPIHHVTPRSRGGTHDWSNVVAACKRDNLGKADQLLSELGWTMNVKPAPPDGHLWRLRHLSDVAPRGGPDPPT